MVGKLNFLTNTRPDLAYSVQHLSQFMQEPRDTHLQALQHTICYVAHTAGQGILMSGTDRLILQAFSDSDWAACPDSRKSISGYVLKLGNSPISWKSKKKATVSRSSSEAEYKSMANAPKSHGWLDFLLTLVCLTYNQ